MEPREPSCGCGCPNHGASAQNSHHSHSHSLSGASITSSSSAPPFTTKSRLSLRSLSGSISSHKRGLAPSSFIDSEARPSTAHSRSLSSPEDTRTLSSSESPRQLPGTGDSTALTRRFSIATTSRPSLLSRTSSVTTVSRYDNSTLWSQQTALKRMSWAWNQTFAGLSPETLQAIEAQRARAKQVNISRSKTATARPSTASSEQTTVSTGSGATNNTVNKPFASRRVSIVRETRPSAPPLPAVTEEEAIDDEQDESEEMGLRRAFSTRFGRTESIRTPERKRPTISLPQLISSTNPQITSGNELDIHPALRNSTSSSGYNMSGSGTPGSETPEMTDSSSIGSRSSTNSPLDGHFESVTGNHLTQYFTKLPPSPTPVRHKRVETIVIASDREDEPATIDIEAGPAPALPTRAASHSKREHLRLARTRSSRSSPTSSRHTSLESAGGAQIVGAGLPQLEEVQEDFNAMCVEEPIAVDEAVMESANVRKLTPSMYAFDLLDLEALRFD